MTIVLLAAVVCEGCGAMSRNVVGTAEDARRELWHDGWRRSGAKGDRCSCCCLGRVLTDYLPGAPAGWCDCGCGERTPIAEYSRAQSGWVRGEPIPRIPGHRTPAPKRDANGCLIWQGRIDPSNGYGRCGSDWAHRWAWKRAHGPIPAGHEIEHTCKVILCIEDAHLLCLTPAEHYARDHRRPKESS